MSEATCSVEGCEAEAKVKGWCKPHYMRQYKHGDLEVQRTVRQGDTCSVEGCERKPHGRNLCPVHLKREARHGSATADVATRQPQQGLTCRGPECARPAVTKGLCGSHEYQERVIGELAPIRVYKPKGGPCGVTGCDHAAKIEGYCQTHQRRRLRGDPNWDRPIKPRAAHGEGHVNEDGYRVITVNGRPKLEHRHLMEQLLGRRLLRTETVHHLNGNRLDNRVDGPLRLVNHKWRSGNLEVWSEAQPAGQEVGHKIEWAVEMLALYAPALLVETLRTASPADAVRKARELLDMSGDLVPEVEA